MSVLGALNNTLIAYFNKEKQQYFNGERSLRNYKKNIPIPFKIQDIRFLHTSKDGKVFHFKLCNLLFCTYLGKDINDKRVLLEKFTKGEVKLCTSSLMLDKNKIHLLAVFEIEKDKAVLDEGLVAEASLSTEYPLVVTIGKNRYTIGDKEEYMYRRLAIQAAINRKQKAAKYNRNQNGKKRQYRTVTQLKDAERNYVNQKQHVYSKRLIDLCKKHGAGTLLLCNQEENEKEMKETPFLLRNWGYYELKNKIKYKAERAGIVLIEE